MRRRHRSGRPSHDGTTATGAGGAVARAWRRLRREGTPELTWDGRDRRVATALLPNRRELSLTRSTWLHSEAPSIGGVGCSWCSRLVLLAAEFAGDSYSAIRSSRTNE